MTNVNHAFFQSEKKPFKIWRLYFKILFDTIKFPPFNTCNTISDSASQPELRNNFLTLGVNPSNNILPWLHCENQMWVHHFEKVPVWRLNTIPPFMPTNKARNLKCYSHKMRFFPWLWIHSYCCQDFEVYLTSYFYSLDLPR